MDVVVGLGEYSEARSRPGGAEPSVDGSKISEGTPTRRAGGVAGSSKAEQNMTGRGLGKAGCGPEGA